MVERKTCCKMYVKYGSVVVDGGVTKMKTKRSCLIGCKNLRNERFEKISKIIGKENSVQYPRGYITKI